MGAFAPEASAVPSPTTQVETSAEAHDLVAVPARFGLSHAQQEALAALKKVRTEMWEKNVVYRAYPGMNFPAGSTLQDVARSFGITTLEQYLDVTVDGDLTWISMQRATEYAAFEGHVRPNNTKFSTAARGDVIPDSESLAKATFPFTLAYIIENVWGRADEQKALIAHGGSFSLESSHLVNLLFPGHTVYGFAGLELGDPSLKHRFVYASHTSPRASSTLVSLPPKGTTRWMYRPALPTETPTGLQSSEPQWPERFGELPSTELPPSISVPRPKPIPTERVSTPVPTPTQAKPTQAKPTPATKAPSAANEGSTSGSSFGVLGIIGALLAVLGAIVAAAHTFVPGR